MQAQRDEDVVVSLDSSVSIFAHREHHLVLTIRTTSKVPQNEEVIFPVISVSPVVLVSIVPAHSADPTSTNTTNLRKISAQSLVSQIPRSDQPNVTTWTMKVKERREQQRNREKSAESVTHQSSRRWNEKCKDREPRKAGLKLGPLGVEDTLIHCRISETHYFLNNTKNKKRRTGKEWRSMKEVERKNCKSTKV